MSSRTTLRELAAEVELTAAVLALTAAETMAMLAEVEVTAAMASRNSDWRSGKT